MKKCPCMQLGLDGTLNHSGESYHFTLIGYEGFSPAEVDVCRNHAHLYASQPEKFRATEAEDTGVASQKERA